MKKLLIISMLLVGCGSEPPVCLQEEHNLCFIELDGAFDLPGINPALDNLEMLVSIRYDIDLHLETSIGESEVVVRVILDDEWKHRKRDGYIEHNRKIYIRNYEEPWHGMYVLSHEVMHFVARKHLGASHKQNVNHNIPGGYFMESWADDTVEMDQVWFLIDEYLRGPDGQLKTNSANSEI